LRLSSRNAILLHFFDFHFGVVVFIRRIFWRRLLVQLVLLLNVRQLKWLARIVVVFFFFFDLSDGRVKIQRRPFVHRPQRMIIGMIRTTLINLATRARLVFYFRLRLRFRLRFRLRLRLRLRFIFRLRLRLRLRIRLRHG